MLSKYNVHFDARKMYHQKKLALGLNSKSITLHVIVSRIDYTNAYSSHRKNAICLAIIQFFPKPPFICFFFPVRVFHPPEQSNRLADRSRFSMLNAFYSSSTHLCSTTLFVVLFLCLFEKKTLAITFDKSQFSRSLYEFYKL